MTQFPQINHEVNGLPRLEKDIQEKQQRKEQSAIRIRRAISFAYTPLQEQIALFGSPLPMNRRDLETDILRSVLVAHFNKLTEKQKEEYREESKLDILNKLCGAVKYVSEAVPAKIASKRFTGSAWQPKHERNGGEPVRVLKSKKYVTEQSSITSTKPDQIQNKGRSGTVKMEMPRHQRSNRGV